MPKEKKTDLIGLRFTKTDKKAIESFISEYNEQNNTDLTLTEFCRTAIFTHIYHLKNSDLIIEETTTETIESQISFLSTLNTFFQNTSKELNKMLSNLQENLSLFKGNEQMIKHTRLISSKHTSNLKK